MEDSPDPIAAVHHALDKLRIELHVTDMHRNAGVKGNPAYLEPAWADFDQALSSSASVMRAPRPGQKIAATWLREIWKRAVNVEAALARYGGDWQELLFQNNDSLQWLVTHGWQLRYDVVRAVGPKLPKLSDLLEERSTALPRIREIAERWMAEAESADEIARSNVVANSANSYLREAGLLLIQALNNLEVSVCWLDDEEFCIHVLNHLQFPVDVIRPHLDEASGSGLLQLVKKLESPHENREEPNQPETSKLGNESAGAAQTIENTDDDFATPVAQSPSGALKLFGPDESAVVDGQKQPTLTKEQYNVLRTLCNVGPNGLGKRELVKTSRHADAVNILKRLATKGSKWESVIILPGVKGRRYRVK